AVMNYAYNGRGEQTRRYPTTASTAQTYASYDEAGHTVGVYDHAGNRIQEVIWLGDLPIGVIDANKLHYVQADHLGTPRNVIDPVAEKSVWAWQLGNEAFGDSAPNQDPDNNGTAFVFDLRFPGQRYDAASGLNQNYQRELDTGSGRYTQADPIGLRGGISAYGYAAGAPTLITDPLGLAAVLPAPLPFPAIPAWLGPAAGVGLSGYGGWLLGSEIYRQNAGSIADAVDAVCRDEPDRLCEKAKADARSAYYSLITKRFPHLYTGGTRGRDMGHADAVLQVQNKLRNAIGRVRYHCKIIPPYLARELALWEWAANVDPISFF
ncbi:RHS repeat-associated core domain-containing protein, partial [Lysobacter sp. Root667]|uniref:RHS repeat-associated core domain-containing protein n=1 Tax=Lysobacter sp. Root667 TaxID=1736581 RepID=UPI000A535B1F